MALPPTPDTSSALAAPGAAAQRLEDLARLAASDLPAAMALARATKAEGLADPLVHHLIALELKDAGQAEAAVVELGAGLQLDPENPRLTTTLGFCLLDLGRRQEAAKVFEAALRLDPKSADAFYGYGWTAERLGALDQARSAWEQAVRLQPAHAHALAGLSGLAARTRDWATTRAYARAALQLNPRQSDALMNLTRAELGEGDHAAAERYAREIIALPDLAAEARANARIMLGDALDGQGRQAEAFAAYAEGKAGLRTLHAPTFEPAGARSARDAVEGMLAEFRTIPPIAWAKPPRATAWTDHRGHAFLLGFPRSGTTLAEQVLASHPEVAALGERPAMITAELEFLSRRGGLERLAGVMGDSLQTYRDDYWRRVKDFGVETRGKVFIDKQPLNTFRLPLISRLFPEAKIIFAERDPRDVVLSCFRRSFNMNASMYEFNTLEGTARYYAAVMEAGEAYMAVLPNPVFRLRYEALVGDFRGVVGSLCDFLGVDWTEAMTAFADTAASRSIATPSSTQVGRGLYEEGVGQWRRYAEFLAPVTPILAPWIGKFGYEAA